MTHSMPGKQKKRNEKENQATNDKQWRIKEEYKPGHGLLLPTGSGRQINKNTPVRRHVTQKDICSMDGWMADCQDDTDVSINFEFYL